MYICYLLIELSDIFIYTPTLINSLLVSITFDMLKLEKIIMLDCMLKLFMTLGQLQQLQC